MDEIVVNGFQLLASYGAMGVVTIYFMVKDWTLNKSLENGLNKLADAINLIAGKGVDLNE